MKAIDLFSGAGGFSLAAHQCGIDVVAAIELDKAASITYQSNLIDRLKSPTKLINGDINEVDLPALMKELKLKSGDLDLLLGGPPCQGFSTHRINDAGIDDPRNQLLLKYFDFVDGLKPKAFLIENVAGLLWSRHEEYLQKLLALAEEHGYTIHFCNILNAKDYGVPQNRKRVFIFGTRKNLNIENPDFPPAATHFSPTSEKTPKWKTASTVFEKLTHTLIEQYIEDYFRPKTNLTDDEARFLLQSLEYGEPVKDDDICKINMQPTPKMIQQFIDTPLNGSREDAGEKHRKTCHSNGYKGHKDVYGRVMIHLPSNTVTTGCNNPSKGRFIHPWQNNGMTLRHAARFQTFPESFNFLGNTTSIAKQIGNAVPPLLAKVLINDICSRLK
ncbi:DNA cytosine methyltransferase [Shewanella sp. TC10]|uniref:DNA cytosine methyltransferase n=1 Tax=Shewanella sp. TC10 TaxID=1419739 RepID=UPI00129E351B|nr:DNA cytosine methyltransferase [Shewanella sp. TC10]